MKLPDKLTAINQEPTSSCLEELNSLLQEKEAIIVGKNQVIEEQQKRIALLEEYLRLERHRRFGPSSEKNTAQGELFDEVEQLAERANTADEEESKPQQPKKKGGRKGLSPAIPREQIYLTLSEEDKAGALDTFFVKVKEELDIVPAKVRVLEYLQEKAVLTDGSGQRTVKSALLPQHPLPKSVASTGMLAYIIVAKYMDALPLYRLEGIFNRYGGSITRTTMANWLIKLARPLQPLINLLRDHQLAYELIQADETRIQVLKEPGRSPTSNKYMWVTLGGPPEQPAVLFTYDASRETEVPLRLFEGYQGYLQTDGYAAYDAVCQENNIMRLGCWDHARRKFVEAKKAEPQNKSQKSNVSKATIALSMIAKLYRIEKEIKELDTQQKYQIRQRHAKPQLENIRQWLDKHKDKVPKDGKIGQAFTYLDNQWDKLVVYCESGKLAISNIKAENAIRPFAIGRKNWMFADTPQGAYASATYYSLIETAKANDLEPYDYFRAILKALPYADSVEKLEALLPWNIDNSQLS